MSTPHDDLLFRRVLDGEPLTRDDERHLATCVACQRAVFDAGRLDHRLREAAGSLADEPIPVETLDVTPMRPGWASRLRLAPAVVAVAAAGAAVAVGLALANPRPPVAIPPSPTPETSQPASPTPSPAVTPSPAAAPVDPYLVTPLSACADGDAGYSVFLPEGWYANRREGATPACQTIGRATGGQPRRQIDPAIYLSVLSDRPTFDEAHVESREQVEVDTGIVVERVALLVPESGALAAEHTLSFVAPLLGPDAGGPGGFLVASTDAGNPEWVDALDSIMDRLELRASLTTSDAAIAEAEALFHDRDVCLDEGRGIGIVFPDAWWWNTAIDDLPACSYFAPAYFEITEPGVVPDGVDISVSLVEGDFGTFHEILGYETLTVLDRPATRWEIGRADGATYQYVVQLGDSPEAGPNLVASTHASGTDLELAKAILDEMMDRITMSAPPPGARSANPPIEAESISATDADGDYRLQLAVEQERYRAGQPILADATLTYVGSSPSITGWGSGTGIVVFDVEQVDGSFHQGSASTSDCRPHELVRDEPVWVEFGKSGEVSGAFSTAYFADDLLRLPPGRWRITVGAGFTAGGDDCGAGESVSLTASVEITVEP